MAAIRKRGDRWQARVKRGGQAAEKSFLNKSDAERWARMTESDIERGTFLQHSEADRQTLSACLDRYAMEITPTKRGAEIEHVRINALKRHKMTSKKMSAIRNADIAAYRDERTQTGIKAGTLAKDLALISHVFKVATSDWGMEGLANPVTAIRKPVVKNARERRLLPGEEDCLLAALTVGQGNGRRGESYAINPWLKPIVVLAIETAMRRGELLGLRWEHIDLNTRVAHLPMTKNGSSRDVPLSTQAVNVLRSLPRAINGQVFPITPNALKLAFPRAVYRARKQYEADGGTDPSLLVDLHFHDLRHEATSRLAEVFQAHELAKITGHKDMRMLLRYYHPKAEDLARKLI